MNPNNKKMPVLPVSAYTSQDWFEKEQTHIFGNTWQFAGLAEDIKESGDYITVQCGLQNILVVKGKDQALRAFHNLCRHRGTQLLRAVGKKQKALTCPYHDWTYDLTGQLISVPDQEREFPDLELDKICLHKAAVGIWRGMIWVHPKPNAMPLEKWFEGCEQYLGPHDPNRLIEYPDTYYEKTIKANWKIVAENYMDVYHLAHLHSNTLQMYDHANAQYGFVGDHYLFWEPLAKKYLDNLDKLIPYKRIAEMTDEYLGAYVPLLFPNLGLSESESTWNIFHIIPISPNETKVVVRTKMEPMTNWEYSKQSMKSYASWHGIMGGETKYGNDDPNDPMASGDFMAEDIYACEQQHKNLKNPLYEVKHTAKFGESTVRTFQGIVERWVEGKEPTNTESKEVVEKEQKTDNQVAKAAQLSVHLRGEEHQVNIEGGQTLLQAMKAAKVRAPFKCQSGVCGTCKAKLTEGEVRMKSCMALDQAQIDSGLILTCQSLPLSDQLKIEYQ